MNKKDTMKTAHRLTRNIVLKTDNYKLIFNKMLKMVHMMNRLLSNKIEGSVRVIKNINIKGKVISSIECVASPKMAFNFIQKKKQSPFNTSQTFITYSIQEQW